MRVMIFLFLLASTIGCGENRPLDLLLTESTKPTNEIVAEGAACYKGVSVDAVSSEYAFRFDKACIDEMLTDDRGGVPDLPEGVTPVELSAIVDDVVAGGTSFLHAWVYVRGLVMTDLTDGGRSLVLETSNAHVNFRVSSFVKVTQLSRYQKGTTYGFILLITGIDERADSGTWNIFSRVDTPENIAKGRSVLTPTVSDVLPTSVNEILESLRKGESYYIGKRVLFLESVKLREEDATFESRGTLYDSLVVYQERVNILTAGRDTFRIYPTMALFEGDIDAKYTEGSFHNFEVTIHYLSGESFFDPDKVGITAYFEDKTFVPWR